MPPRSSHPVKVSKRSIYGLFLGSAGMLAALVMLHREVHRMPTSAQAPTAITSGKQISSASHTTPSTTRPDRTRPELSEPMLAPSEDPWN